jgi:hypothetical protein
MVRIFNGRYTARIDAPFAVFIIGMWLPIHKDASRSNHQCAERLI